MSLVYVMNEHELLENGLNNTSVEVLNYVVDEQRWNQFHKKCLALVKRWEDREGKRIQLQSLPQIKRCARRLNFSSFCEMFCGKVTNKGAAYRKTDTTIELYT